MAFRALLIGNWLYNSPEGGMPPLRGPEHDLPLLKDALIHPVFGLFKEEDVKIYENLTAVKLSDVLAEAADQSQDNDNLFIYYSGHGERLGAEQRLGLVGVDVPYNKRFNRAFHTFQLKQWLDESRARFKILVLDCCFSGQFRDAELVNEEEINAFGEGTVVLASGGNQVVPDAVGSEGPSPFTSALSSVLVDETLAGSSGLLTAEDVYVALDRYEPRLRPRPKRNFNAQGRIGLAIRPSKVAANELVVRGWPDRIAVLPVSLTFAGDHVTAVWDRNDDGHMTNDERDVAALDQTRLAAIRRLCQLADAVMRARDYREPDWQSRARRALETAGANLFEAALPPGLKQLLREADQERDLLVRLDLSFQPPWSVLTEYPWEFLHVPGDERIDPTDDTRRRVIIARAARIAEWPSRHGEDKADVAVVSSLMRPYALLAERIGTELVAMSSVRTVSTPDTQPANWARFLDAVDQKPEYLVLCTPLRRESLDGRVTAKLGFAGRREIDWRDTATVAAALRAGERNGANKLSAVVLISVAADAGYDAIRAAPTAAGALNAELGKPIVFVCHTPGVERYLSEEVTDEPQTFVGLLLAALTTGHDLDQSVWFARDRVLRFVPADFQPSVGVPGFFYRSVAAAAPKPTTGDRISGAVVNRSRPGKA
jgi:hypothetical protein